MRRLETGLVSLALSAGLSAKAAAVAGAPARPEHRAGAGARAGALRGGGQASGAAATGARRIAALDLVAAAIERTTHRVTYDGAYRRIPYPNGDVPDDVGVCTDLVIRSYRAVGIDLQRQVHEDMRAAFHEYPTLWGSTRPDANIDHRRVPNLQAFFRRQGAALARSGNPADYAPGDLVTWMLPGNLPHIGIVASARSPGGRPLVVHNIGRGPEVEDALFAFEITGHYRYLPARGASPEPGEP